MTNVKLSRLGLFSQDTRQLRVMWYRGL